MKGDESLALSLKIKLPPTWDDKSVDEAILQPFIKAYDKKYPDNPASAFAPFTRVKVLVWAGPTKCASDAFRLDSREGAEDIKIAEQPIYALMDVEEPVKALRKRTHNRLKPTIELELIKAESTAIVLRTVPSTALLAPGEKLITMLGDTSCDPEEMHQLVDAAIAGGPLAYLGVVTARDRSGRNPLHLAATRGDATLCRKLLRRREDVFAMDSNRDTAIHISAMAGRSIVVRDLLELGALVNEKVRHSHRHPVAIPIVTPCTVAYPPHPLHRHEAEALPAACAQNRDLMLPLNLAVVEEAQGNGEVVRMIIEHGADIDSKCWDVTPLMAAAAGGHYWAIETLLELGADVNIRNGYEMMPLDYARDVDTSELLYDVMRGFYLPSPKDVKEQAAWKERRRKNMSSVPPMPGMPGYEKKEPRMYQARRRLPLPAAFAALELDDKWLQPFKETGAHYKTIRFKWRSAVLKFHPDRQPANMSDEALAANTAEYMKAIAAFESIDEYYTSHFAEKPAAAGEGTSPREATGAAGAPAAAEPTVDLSDAAHSGFQDLDSPSPPAAAEGKDAAAAAGSDADKGPSKFAASATARASRPLLLKQRVRVHGLMAKPEYNGRTGRAVQFDRTALRYAVELDALGPEEEGGEDTGGEKLKVREGNLKLLAEEEEEEGGLA